MLNTYLIRCDYTIGGIRCRGTQRRRAKDGETALAEMRARLIEADAKKVKLQILQVWTPIFLRD